MKIIYTDHSKERISERKILSSDIKKAINSPTSVLLSYPPTQKIQKIIKGKTLEVIFKQKGQTIIIITAYYL
ncbi:MAG: DUF4258 domain-containing protein [Firmicutes bacterium]|nr:DUF4258 domain-containing protein [Bacillota bacterium]